MSFMSVPRASTSPTAMRRSRSGSPAAPGSYTTTVKTFGATTAQVLALADYLLSQRVTTVVMEATSDYWKPFYYVMEDRLPVMLVNARHARNIPGRKSDVSDAAWLANSLSTRASRRALGVSLAQCGLRVLVALLLPLLHPPLGRRAPCTRSAWPFSRHVVGSLR